MNSETEKLIFMIEVLNTPNPKVNAVIESVLEKKRKKEKYFKFYTFEKLVLSTPNPEVNVLVNTWKGELMWL